MKNNFSRSLTNLLADDLKASRIVFSLIGLSFLAFAIFAANAPLTGSIPHRLLNLIPFGTALLMWLYVMFFSTTTARRQTLLTALIYEINIIEVYLVYATQHMDMYCYQFIVSYVLSTYFFTSKKSLWYFVLVINLCLLGTVFGSYARSTGPADFYMTYFVCQVVFAVLYKYKFMVEERLQDSERRYRLLAENSFDMICVHDITGRLQFVSPSVKRILGYEPESLVGKFPGEFSHEDDIASMTAINFKDPEQAFLNKPFEYRLRNSDGKYTWFEVVFTLVDKLEDEQIILSQSRDISKRKQYQLALEERTKELERSNADLETFAFVSSHDMQEPLRMISNYTQLLKKRYSGKLDPAADEYLNFANNGAVTLQQLLRDLLSYTRIARADVKPASVNMNALLEDVLRNLKIEIEEKNAQVLYSPLDSVHGDRNLIMLVMQNLVQNGIKYNRSGQPEIKISCTRQGKEVTFCVQDNGIGIDEKHRQKVFEPFQRLHTKNEYPGTGLGLAICKKIIEKSNGRIWFESEPERGTRFYFSLS